MNNGHEGVQILSSYTGKTVLAIGAHPDDAELGVGGTLACLSDAGVRVVIAVVSIPNHLEVRREEARRSAQLLGCEVRVLIPDRPSRVEDLKHYQLVSMIDALVVELSPVAVFSHCLANFNVDHKLVYEVCMASQRLSYFDVFCYAPTTCRPANLPFTPHAFVDISNKIETKMKAINTHVTQFCQRGFSADHYRELDRRNGQLIGVEYAEGLDIVRLRLNWNPHDKGARAHSTAQLPREELELATMRGLKKMKRMRL